MAEGLELRVTPPSSSEARVTSASHLSNSSSFSTCVLSVRVARLCCAQPTTALRSFLISGAASSPVYSICATAPRPLGNIFSRCPVIRYQCQVPDLNCEARKVKLCGLVRGRGGCRSRRDCDEPRIDSSKAELAAHFGSRALAPPKIPRDWRLILA
jgi:hypothetical protein